MTLHPIILNTLINIWRDKPETFDKLEEFSFVKPLSEKIKRKGCTCGLGGEIATTTSVFNEVAQNLSPDSVAKIKSVLDRDELCFGIQKDGEFSVKCY